MDVVETEKLDLALLYLQRITEGKNPVNNMPADDDAIINNPNVVRCMFFIKEVLEEVKRHDGHIGEEEKKHKYKSSKPFPTECLEAFEYSGIKPISELTEQLNQLSEQKGGGTVAYRTIKKWLIKNGYLIENTNDEKKRNKAMPSDKGSEIGITTQRRKTAFGNYYTVILYGKEAQELIVKNMTEILAEEE